MFLTMLFDTGKANFIRTSNTDFFRESSGSLCTKRRFLISYKTHIHGANMQENNVSGLNSKGFSAGQFPALPTFSLANHKQCYFRIIYIRFY